MDRGAWQATAYRVAKSQTQLTQLSTRAYRHIGTGSLDVGKGMQAFEGETVVFQWKRGGVGGADLEAVAGVTLRRRKGLRRVFWRKRQGLRENFSQRSGPRGLDGGAELEEAFLLG